MPHQDQGPARAAACQGLGMLDEFIAQVGPIAGDRVPRIVAEFFDGADRVTSLTPHLEQLGVGARREPIAV